MSSKFFALNEYPTPGEDLYLDEGVIQGADRWDFIGMTPIIAVSPTGHCYFDIFKNLPDSTIIGLKIGNIARRLDDVEAFRTLGKLILYLMSAGILKNFKIWLEAETLCSTYWTGEQVIAKYAKVTEAFAQLPQGIVYTFYPAFFWSNTAVSSLLLSRQDKLAKAIRKAHPSCTFVDTELSKPPGNNDWWAPMSAEIRNKYDSEATPGQTIAYPDKTWKYQPRFWMNSEFDILHALTLRRETDLVFDPGFSQWNNDEYHDSWKNVLHPKMRTDEGRPLVFKGE